MLNTYCIFDRDRVVLDRRRLLDLVVLGILILKEEE